MAGKLIIKPLSAQLTHDTDWFGKMDPYCIIKVGDTVKQSSVHKNAGKSPSWNDEMVFNRHYENLIIIEVWDTDTFKKDDLIGELSKPLENILKNNNYIGTYQLKYENKVAGSIRLEIIWRPVEPKTINTAKDVPPRDTVYNALPPVQPHKPWPSPPININQLNPYLNSQHPSLYPTSINNVYLQTVPNQYSGHSNIYTSDQHFSNQAEYPLHNPSIHQNYTQTNLNTKGFSPPIGSPSSNPIQNSFPISGNYKYKP